MTDLPFSYSVTFPLRVHCLSCGEADYALPGDGVCATCGNGTRPL